jgi:hypothetical protein
MQIPYIPLLLLTGSAVAVIAFLKWDKIRGGSKRIFTYTECVKYFVSHKNDSDKIIKGALSKKEISNGRLELMLFFVDKNENPVCDDRGNPLGFKAIRAGLDDELKNMFRNNDLIFFE